jgi:hypothetical protein
MENGSFHLPYHGEKGPFWKSAQEQSQPGRRSRANGLPELLRSAPAGNRTKIESRKPAQDCRQPNPADTRRKLKKTGRANGRIV